MNFNTLEFALFFPLVLVLLSGVFHRERARDLLLLVVSYLFYMAWYWEYAGLLVLSTLIDYSLGLHMQKSSDPRKRKALLTTSLVLNLGILGLFKYYNFFADMASGTLGFFGWELDFLRHELLLPVGISFYTFQSLSYTIDVYRRELPAEKSLTKFALFVVFFPQLVAGPIVRAVDFLPQLHKKLRVTKALFLQGLTLVFLGLCKKIFLADTLASLGVDAVFDDPAAYSSADLLLALYGYAFQIYCDFSGYSDIAIGAAAMMGFWLPPNFNRPYLAQNLREFWTRWHISLSTWLKDYLYISLGGNRGTRFATARNLMLTMLLGGLWHGAAINFLLWGAVHGLFLMFSRGQTRRPDEDAPWRVWGRRLLTFHLVCFTWLLFRIHGWEDFLSYAGGLAEFSGGSVLHPLYYGLLALAFVLHATPKDRLAHWWDHRWIKAPAPVQAGAYAVLILAFIGFSLDTPSFIYFQF
ncbi:MAG: MBOAT family protein [Gammaproteobacteria bacterium]|nr:MBOAT family protein [Gammaproteobacteria bacterium]